MKIKIDNLTITVESSNPVKTDLKTSTVLMEKTNLKRQNINNNLIRIKMKSDNSIDSSVSFDINELVKLFKYFFESESKYYKYTTSYEKACFDLLKSDDSETYCLFDEGFKNILACVVIKRKSYTNEPDDAIRIRMLVTNQKHQKKGYATECLKFAENLAIDANKYKMRVRVFVENTKAYTLYKKYGFKEIKRYK